MGIVVVALDRPAVTGVLSHWTVQPLAIVLAVVLAIAYIRGVRALDRPWPARRNWLFGLGLALLIWTTCGFPQVYADSLFWVWTGQTLTIWLVVPVLILSGQPVQLWQQISGPRGIANRVLESRPVRIIGNPVIGPGLVPVLSAGLFFGPIPGWSIQYAPVSWVIHLLLLALGAVMVIPLVGLEEGASSLAVALTTAIGSVELILDAIPGVVLRLNTHLVTSYFDYRAAHPWSPTAIHDQQIGGAVLWGIAELIDVPFLVLVFGRWLRADARDAARVDAVLDAERAARRGLDPEVEGDSADSGPDEVAPERDVPWWLSDPEMVERLRRQG